MRVQFYQSRLQSCLKQKWRYASQKTPSRAPSSARKVPPQSKPSITPPSASLKRTPRPLSHSSTVQSYLGKITEPTLIYQAPDQGLMVFLGMATATVCALGASVTYRLMTSGGEAVKESWKKAVHVVSIATWVGCMLWATFGTARLIKSISVVPIKPGSSSSGRGHGYTLLVTGRAAPIAPWKSKFEVPAEKAQIFGRISPFYRQVLPGQSMADVQNAQQAAGMAPAGFLKEARKMMFAEGIAKVKFEEQGSWKLDLAGDFAETNKGIYLLERLVDES